jgi:hypothetical protein
LLLWAKTSDKPQILDFRNLMLYLTYVVNTAYVIFLECTSAKAGKSQKSL